MSSIPDIAIFITSISIPFIIFLICTFVKKSKEFLSKHKIGFIPLAFSLAVSNLSVNNLIGISGTILIQGLVPSLTYSIAAFISSIAIGNLLISQYYQHSVSHVYKYLEQRYESPILGILSSTLYILSSLWYIATCFQTSTFVLCQLTSKSFSVVYLLLGAYCIFYTTISDLKTIIWTDVFHYLIVLGALSGLLYQGSRITPYNESDSFFSGDQNHDENGQNFYFDFNPMSSSNTLGIFLCTFLQFSYIFGCNQSTGSRFLLTASKSQASRAITLSAFLFLFLTLLLTWLGVVLSKGNCHSDSKAFIKHERDVLLFFVIQQIEDFPGLFGIFTASLVCVTLSSVASELSSVSNYIIENYFKNIWKSPSNAQWILCSKSLSLTICLSLLIVSYWTRTNSQIRNVLHSFTSLPLSFVSGSLFSIFLLGTCTKFSNKTGAISGLLLGTCLPLCLTISSQFLFKTIRDEEKEPENERLNTSLLLRADMKNFLVSESILEKEELGSLVLQTHSLLAFLLTTCLSVLFSYGVRNKRNDDLSGSILSDQRDVSPSTEGTENNSHYRWPSPSLPPTLRKERKKNLLSMRVPHNWKNYSLYEHRHFSESIDRRWSQSYNKH